MDQEKAAKREFLHTVREFNERAAQLGLGDLSKYYWYHTIELPNGLVTPGQYDFRTSVSSFQFPEKMHGMNVLDVGSATGFFSFEFEKRGAGVTSVEIPTMESLDRFPGQKIEPILRKIEEMMRGTTQSDDTGKGYNSEELYFYLLEGPFEFCRNILNSRIERAISTVYELSSVLENAAFDMVFMGDILLHTINPLQALASAASLCSGVLIMSQVIPGDPDDPAAMIYVGGNDINVDEISWWLPNRQCFEQMLMKLGFKRVSEVGIHSGTMKPTGFPFTRSILHAYK